MHYLLPQVNTYLYLPHFTPSSHCVRQISRYHAGYGDHRHLVRLCLMRGIRSGSRLLRLLARVPDVDGVVDLDHVSGGHGAGAGTVG